MGKAAIHLVDIGQVHRLHHLLDAGLAARLRQVRMEFQHLLDLLADAGHRVKRGHRFLKDHRHHRGAQIAHPRRPGGGQFLALQPDRPVDDLQRGRQQAHRGQRRQRLARPGFADEAHRLSRLDAEIEALDHLLIRIAVQRDPEARDFQKAHRSIPRLAIRGSSASRTASPRRLIDRIATETASPGHRTIPGLIWK